MAKRFTSDQTFHDLNPIGDLPHLNENNQGFMIRDFKFAVRHLLKTPGSTAFAACVFVGLTTTLADTQPTQNSDAIVLPSDAEIHKMLVERLGAEENGVGIVVGVVEPQGRRIISYGHPSAGDLRPLNGDTVFEIGSVTKVFTALLFADMVLRGEVAPEDPAAKYLPDSVKVPDFEGAPITLLDLATYTSGLPRMPSNFAPKDPNNPYIDYTADRLYDYLSNHKLGFKPGM